MLPAEREAATLFLRALFPEIPENCAILIWTLKDRRSHWATSIEQAVELADAAGGKDVYVGCCLQPRGLGPSKRGTKSTVLAIPGLYMDVDFGANPAAHKSGKKYPPTIEEAQALCESMPWMPSPLVMSGHGLQPWWLFKELWILDTPEERAKAARLVEGWQRLLARKAAEKGWDLDSTQDLARILRLPGTWNTKNAAEPRAVTTLYMPERLYDPADAEEYLPVEPEPAKPTKGKASKEACGTGPGWTLCAQAMAPPEKLSLALAQVEGFAETWRRKRKLHGPRGDQSLSAYDYSLAVQMTRLGWTDQQIVDGLVQFRREQGEPKLRVDYYRTTLAKARKDGAPSELDELIEECEVRREEAKDEERAHPDPTQPSSEQKKQEESEPPADSRGTFSRKDVSEKKREASRKMVSGWLGFKVDRVEQTRSEDPMFTMVTEHGTIRIGPVAALHRQATFRSAIWTMTHEYPAKLKGKQWDTMVNALGDLAVIVDVGTEATPKGRALAEVGAYLRAQPPVDIEQHTKDIFVGPGEPILADGKIWFSGEDFARWFQGYYHRPLDPRDRGLRLRALGGTQRTHRWPARDGEKSKVVFAWAIPAKIFDDFQNDE